MVQLKELMGTKYITNEHAAELRKVLDKNMEVRIGE